MKSPSVKSPSVKSPSTSSDKLTFNRKFASDYESKKRRQELSRASELGLLDEGDDSDSSSSSESDSDAEMLTDDVDLKVLQTIQKIRSKDPSIYDPSKEFFSSPSSSAAEVKRKGEKRMAYKDVVRTQALEDIAKEEGGKGGEEGVEEERRRFAYDDEQEEIRRAFLDGVDGEEEDEEEGEGMLKMKEMTKTDEERERRMEEEFNRMDKAKSETFSPYKDPKGEVEDADAFLREFTVKRKWKEEEEFKGLGEEELMELEDEDREDEDVDRFESKYNFRFEEEGGGGSRGTAESRRASGRKTARGRTRGRRGRRGRG